MKNLENKEILSDELLKAIELIIQESPQTVFGGSIALNAIGLINRKIKDIDIFFNWNESLAKNGFLNIKTIGEIQSDTVTNTNGVEIQRTGALINNIHTCCFKVSPEELQSTKHEFERSGIKYSIWIQNVNYVIEAKKAYANKNTKHKEDLMQIDKTLGDLF